METELFTTPALLEMTKIYMDANWGVGVRTAVPTSARPPLPLLCDACRLRSGRALYCCQLAKGWIMCK